MAQTIWRGHLTFGLVSFPVRLFKAARAEKVQFRRLYRPAAPPPSAPEKASGKREPAPAPPAEPEVFRTHNRVIAPPAAAAPAVEPNGARAGGDAPDEPFEPPPAELVKGFEYEKGRYVVLEKDELESIVPETSKEMQVLEFVHLHEIDPIFFETSYYVRPDEAGQRPYALLYQALKEAGYVGLAQLAMHRREHVVVIRPGRAGMIAHTMFFADEIRAQEEYTADTNDLVPRELDLAKRLIETMAVPFEPSKFRDTYRERVQAMIDAKLAGKEVAKEPAAPVGGARVVDIFEALQNSLNAIKKPPAPAEPAPSAAKRRTRKAG